MEGEEKDMLVWERQNPSYSQCELYPECYKRIENSCLMLQPLVPETLPVVFPASNSTECDTEYEMGGWNL